jgi:hypothetical protein
MDVVYYSKTWRCDLGLPQNSVTIGELQDFPLLDLIFQFSVSTCYQQSMFSEDLGPCAPNGRIQVEHMDG